MTTTSSDVVAEALPPHTPTCMGCGPDNPNGLQMTVFLSGQQVYTDVTFDERQAGAPGLAHGGAIAAACDDLFGFTLIERNIAWYLVNGRVSGQRAEALTDYIDRLIGRLRDHALDLVEAFGLGDDLLRAEIATGIEAERQQEAQDYVDAQRAAGLWPVHEKELRAAAKAEAKAAAKAAKAAEKSAKS